MALATMADGPHEILTARETRDGRGGQSGQNASEVAELMNERRCSSVAEQLIRKQPQLPAARTQHDVNPGN
jgi:hypothetical protein